MTSRRLAIFTLLLALPAFSPACASGRAAGASAEPRPGVAVPDSPRLYVANQSGASVSIIDIDRREVIETVDLTKLGFSTNCKPHDTAVEPDGSYWYVTLIVDGKILKFDRDDHLVGQADFETPGMLALDPTSDRLWVGRSMAAVNPPPSVGLIDRSDMSIEEIDVVFPRPHAMAVTPDGSHAYTASLAENRIAIIDAASERVDLMEVPGDTLHTFVQFAVSPDGGTLVVTGQTSGQLLIFDLADPGHPVLEKQVAVGGQPWHPSYTPDGKWVVVPQNASNSVTVVDASTWTVAGEVEGADMPQPHGSAAAPDGSLVFVSNQNTGGGMDMSASGEHEEKHGTVVAFDPVARKVVATLTVGPYAAGIAAPRPR